MSFSLRNLEACSRRALRDRGSSVVWLDVEVLGSVSEPRGCSEASCCCQSGIETFLGSDGSLMFCLFACCCIFLLLDHGLSRADQPSLGEIAEVKSNTNTGLFG